MPPKAQRPEKEAGGPENGLPARLHPLQESLARGEAMLRVVRMAQKWAETPELEYEGMRARGNLRKAVAAYNLLLESDR